MRDREVTKAQLRERLGERIAVTGTTPHALSKAIGANAGYVRDLLDPEKTSIPSGERIIALAAQLGTTSDWLLGKAESPEQVTSEVSIRELPRGFSGRDAPGMPVLGTAYCDDLAVEGEDGLPLQVERVLLDIDHTVRLIERPPALWNAKDAYAIYCHGSSMEPKFEQGDLAVVDPRRPPRPGDYVVVQLNDGSNADVITVLVKRLIKVTSAYVGLEQFNPPLTFRIPRRQVTRLHRICNNNELYGA